MSNPPLISASAEVLSAPVQAFRLVLALAQELRTLMDRRLQPSGLTSQQAAVLTVIEILGQPSMTEAARALATTHQNLKQLASALARKGFIRIEPDPRDSRSKRLMLTETHRSFWTARNQDDHASVAQWLSALDDDETARLVQLLSKAMAGARVARRQGSEAVFPNGARPG
jgi:DNA-binding MarR family transcriptional regulator